MRAVDMAAPPGQGCGARTLAHQYRPYSRTVGARGYALPQPMVKYGCRSWPHKAATRSHVRSPWPRTTAAHGHSPWRCTAPSKAVTHNQHSGNLAPRHNLTGLRLRRAAPTRLGAAVAHAYAHTSAANGRARLLPMGLYSYTCNHQHQFECNMH